jgi:hypothetical protein
MKIIRRGGGKQKKLPNTKAYDELYWKLGTKDGEKNMYKLAKTMEMKTRVLNGVKCIKDGDRRVLVKEEEIKERWKSYFDILFNGSNTR